jgi:hypothetical protein
MFEDKSQKTDISTLNIINPFNSYNLFSEKNSQYESIDKHISTGLSLLTSGSTYVRIMEYYQDEKARFERKDFTFDEMENFIFKYYDSKCTMKVKILEKIDSSLVLGNFLYYYINVYLNRG